MGFIRFFHAAKFEFLREFKSVTGQLYIIINTQGSKLIN